MRAWILALVHTVWTLHGLQGECWMDPCDPISSDGLRRRAR
jgi:hypothetical protein